MSITINSIRPADIPESNWNYSIWADARDLIINGRVRYADYIARNTNEGAASDWSSEWLANALRELDPIRNEIAAEVEAERATAWPALAAKLDREIAFLRNYPLVA